MKKTKLKLETLRVTSFETVGMEHGTGTVLGQERAPLPPAEHGTLSFCQPCIYSDRQTCPIRCT